LDEQLPFESLKRVFITGGLAASLFLATTTDRDNRWTWNLTAEYLTADNPELAGWLPDKGGILYSPDMLLFYETFFKNPTADWRYAVGFEPSMMLPEDLEVLRKAQWNFGDSRAQHFRCCLVGEEEAGFELHHKVFLACPLLTLNAAKGGRRAKLLDCPGGGRMLTATVLHGLRYANRDYRRGPGRGAGGRDALLRRLRRKCGHYRG